MHGGEITDFFGRAENTGQSAGLTEESERCVLDAITRVARWHIYVPAAQTPESREHVHQKGHRSQLFKEYIQFFFYVLFTSRSASRRSINLYMIITLCFASSQLPFYPTPSTLYPSHPLPTHPKSSRSLAHHFVHFSSRNSPSRPFCRTWKHPCRCALTVASQRLKTAKSEISLLARIYCERVGRG